MSLIPKKYFHDRVVLFLLSINIFLAATTIILTLASLNKGSVNNYTVQYRSNQGLDAYKSSNASTFIAFMVFAVGVLLFHWYLSMRTYNIRRHFATGVLAMATLLLIVGLIVSNALLSSSL